MKMKPIITTLLLLLFRLLSAQSLTDSLDLAQLHQLAEQHALGVATAEANARIATLDQEILKAQLKPRLDLTANLPNFFSSFSETVQPDGTVAFRPVTINNSSVSLRASQTIAATGGRLFASTSLQRFDDYENKLNSYNGSPVRIGIIQPIWGFNAWKWDKKILPLIQQAAQVTNEVAKLRAKEDVTLIFFDLLAAQQSRNIALSNQAASQRLLEIANERFELGKINRGDLVQIELELAAAGQNLLSAERQLAAASRAIHNFLGIPYEGRLLAAKLPEAPPALIIDESALIDRLVSKRPEFIIAMQEELEGQREVERTKRQLGPQINLQASIGLVRSDLELAPIYTNPQAEQIVSLQLNVPILDWGERRKSIEQSQARLEIIQTNNKRSLLGLKGQASLLLQQYKALSEELQLAGRISQLAQERFTISQESYLLGSIPLTELTLAQQNRDQLARTYLNTLSAYWRVWAALKTMI